MTADHTARPVDLDAVREDLDYASHDPGNGRAMTAVDVARKLIDEVERLRRKRAAMLRLIGDLVDADDCWFDHHGGCQAHGYLSLEPGEKCPQQEAKELIEASNGGGQR